jgi:hypothetical protein
VLLFKRCVVAVESFWAVIVCLLCKVSVVAVESFWNVQSGAGTGNTALVFHAKKLLALHEGDLPYAVRPHLDPPGYLLHILLVLSGYLVLSHLTRVVWLPRYMLSGYLLICFSQLYTVHHLDQGACVPFLVRLSHKFGYAQ